MSIEISEVLSPELAKLVDTLAGNTLNGVRKETWKLAAATCAWHEVTRLVETGCYRGTAADGCSTVILAQLAKDLGGMLDSYELSPANIAVARRELDRYRLLPCVQFHVGDSVLNLARRTAPVDFAYLDSFDCGEGPDYAPCQEHQLAELEAILPLMSPRAAVMLDDNISESVNKTVLAMKRLTSLDWDCVATSYQVLFSCEDTQRLIPHEFAVLAGHLDEYAALAAYTIYRNRAQYCLRHGYDLRLIRHVPREFCNSQSHASGFTWGRLQEMLRLVESGAYEWVWCMGTDTLVTNMTVTLESIVAPSQTSEAEALPLPQCPVFENSPAPLPVIEWQPPADHPRAGKKHLLICGERVTAMQADSFFVRCTPEGAAYLRDILAHYDQYKHHVWVENQAMIDLREKHAAITFMVPQWQLNAYDYRRFESYGPWYKDGIDCYGNRGQWQPGDFLIHWPAAKLEERMKWLADYTPQIIK